MSFAALRPNGARVATMDIKLALLLLVISAIITLSYLDEENVASIKQQLLRWQWRKFRLRRNKL
jgi:hypothetical protein